MLENKIRIFNKYQNAQSDFEKMTDFGKFMFTAFFRMKLNEPFGIWENYISQYPSYNVHMS